MARAIRPFGLLFIAIVLGHALLVAGDAHAADRSDVRLAARARAAADGIVTRVDDATCTLATAGVAPSAASRFLPRHALPEPLAAGAAHGPMPMSAPPPPPPGVRRALLQVYRN